jgi:two-component system, cell cycle response regulator
MSRETHGGDPPRDDAVPAPDDPTCDFEVPPVAQELARSQTAGDLAPCLLLLAGLDMGQVVEIPAAGLVIGRGGESTLQLRDDGLSRVHARVALDGTGALRVVDLDSTNGTFISGRRIADALLWPGEKIVLGRNTVLKFVVQDAMDRRYHAEMFESTTRDGLTGVFNRKHLVQKLIADLSFARRHRIPFTLLIFDVDHFKRVNDTFGHQAGDEVLVAIARVVEDAIRTEDILGRYGGEEFAVIAQGTPSEGAFVLGERIRKRVEDEPALAADARGDPIRATVSVGGATLSPGALADAPKMISAADENLYAAKAAGRNRTVCGDVGEKLPRTTQFPRVR